LFYKNYYSLTYFENLNKANPQIKKITPIILEFTLGMPNIAFPVIFEERKNKEQIKKKTDAPLITFVNDSCIATSGFNPGSILPSLNSS